MWKSVAGVALMGALSGVGASFYLDYRTNGFGDRAMAETGAQQSHIQSPSQVNKATAAAKPVVVTPTDLYGGRKYKIKADRRGHFVTKVKMNGRKVSVLVDTGASSIAINKSLAKRLGIKLSKSDFKYRVNTANGTVKAAAAVIDRVDMGRISVKNVQAAVLPDKSLNDVLLGMSFLNQLKSFEVRNGELVLKQ